MKELFTWPNWAVWVILIAVLVSLVMNFVLLKRVNDLHTKYFAPPVPYRNRDELEAAFRAGEIDRAEYEQLKRKIS